MRLRSRRQGASGLYVLACVFLFAGIGYLAVSQFRSRRELLNSRFRELTQDVGTKGTTFGYFWGERANDVRHLVESRELRSYFENEALGMSAQYGLRASLLAVEDLFDRVRQSKRLEGRTVYERIVLVDALGEPLVISGGARPSEKDGEWRNHVRRDDPISFLPCQEQGETQIVVSAPYFFKGKYGGQLLAWVPLSLPCRRFIGEWATGTSTAVALGRSWAYFPERAGRFVSRELQAAPPLIPPSKPVSFSASGPTTPGFFALRVPVAETPFELVTFVTAIDAFDPGAPHRLLVSTVGLAILILAGMLLVVRLNSRNSVLRAREEEVRSLNADLERRVRERTAQLEEANKELEAFSHSVSHDLRAPLRAIEGLSAALVEDHGAALDEEGRRLAGQVRANAKRTGLLIRDLLKFSQVVRLEAQCAALDMRALAVEACAECLPDARARARVELSVGELPEAWADRGLMKQVWVNLVSNAVKFSARRERPVIEVFGRREGDSVVYVVRDNGAGFDMARADRLFGVFQRLHGSEEFEGTGVGLSLVHRIVTRHGGRIWAESEVGQGSTFTFALPLEPPRAGGSAPP
ncbi:MAG: hypothetical protein IPN83_18695 [Holophagales bacterium]|nr:hypothetical protein [Holophagales bacterium]